MAARSSLSTQHRFGYIVAMLDLPHLGADLGDLASQKNHDVMLATRAFFGPAMPATNP